MNDTTQYGNVVIANIEDSKFKLNNRYIITVSDSEVQNRECSNNCVTWYCDEHLDTVTIDFSKVNLYLSGDAETFDLIPLTKVSGNQIFVIREESSGSTTYKYELSEDGSTSTDQVTVESENFAFAHAAQDKGATVTVTYTVK